jgi:hypothetical protein
MYFAHSLARSALTAAIAGVLLALIAGGPSVPYWYGKWLLFDSYDLIVYFNSSSWVIEGGHLYRDVWSEYPFLANVVFAIWRYLANFVYPGLIGFEYVWMISAGVIFLWALCRVAADATPLAILAWVTPASIYFALYRFDIYPAVVTLVALFAIRRAAYTEGAIWLGVAAAFKGYTLFMVPAFCVFMVYQRGFVAAIRLGALVLVPTVLAMLATLMFVSWQEALAPFRFQAQRGLNDQSTYDAINYFINPLFATQLKLNQIPLIPQFLQLASALAAAAMRPKTFEELVNAFLFATLGFMTFSVFYSPQFMLWILPLICFSSSRAIVSLAIVFNWLTYLYFPVIFHLTYGKTQTLYHTIVVAISLLRLSMMMLTVLLYFEIRIPVRYFERLGGVVSR